MSTAAANSAGKLLIIAGQTAAGKSALALELAKKFNGEIICADSRTIYKGMDIGTAKPTARERREVPHHLVDVVAPDERFTAADFKQLATEVIDDIIARDKLPIMVGGTGLYIDAVLYDYSFTPAGSPRDPQNPRHAAKGAAKSQALRQNTLILGLQAPREVLEPRISKRVEQMLADDFVEEVNGLLEKYDENEAAFNATSYRPFINFLKGRLTLNEAKQKFVQNDLQLAKRQKTWFKRNRSIQWVNSPLEATQLVADFLNKSE